MGMLRVPDELSGWMLHSDLANLAVTVHVPAHPMRPGCGSASTRGGTGQTAIGQDLFCAVRRHARNDVVEVLACSVSKRSWRTVPIFPSAQMKVDQILRDAEGGVRA